jgi:hypothetical protein
MQNKNKTGNDAAGNDAALVLAVDKPPTPGVNDPVVTDEPDDVVPGAIGIPFVIGIIRMT